MDFNEQFLRGCAQNRIDDLAHALSNGAHPQALTPDGDNALHLACAFGHHQLIDGLLRAGVDPNQQNAAGLTPAHEAVVGMHPLCLNALLQSPALDLSATDKNGLTAEQAARQALERQQGQELGVA